MTAIAGYNGQITLAQPPNVAITNQVLQDSGDHTTFTVKTVDAAKRYWDSSVSFVFQTSPDGVTWTTVTPASVQYVTGQVTFASAVTGATPSARISSGAYLPYSTASDCKAWEIMPQVQLLESTSFLGTGVANNRFKTYLPALLGADVKITRFYVDQTLFTALTTAPTPLLIVSLYTGRTSGERWECYARLKQAGVKAAVAALIENDLALTANGPVYYFAN